ncbi:hypothetical protein T07_8575 [Trichinella nelsoni]|uniref:Uncharacterized protein n=1 Tax=Trichinella nelsoni TaxID=6336 RepID=A0A0V0SI68_9BILA|nr:hypothetical protein T07_8575 [Trichinella nelsoni]
MDYMLPSRQRQGICRRDELKEHQTILSTNKIDNKFNTLKTTSTLQIQFNNFKFSKEQKKKTHGLAIRGRFVDF